jgi:hypothetical protein
MNMDAAIVALAAIVEMLRADRVVFEKTAMIGVLGRWSMSLQCPVPCTTRETAIGSVNEK